ncbi:MAG: ATP-binding protein [Pseudomonadota bacterium]|nr:ATP-binding protein [Pseudomonadota bacterium]
MPATRLYNRLIWLAVLAIAPLALVSALALGELLRQQGAQTKQSALGLSRALAATIDNELRLSVSALQSLALTQDMAPVDGEPTAQARELAVHVLTSHPEWMALLLFARDGKVVLNTNTAASATQISADDESVSDVIRTRTAKIGALTPGRPDDAGIPVYVPVIRDGEVRFVLTAVLRPEALVGVVKRQQVPDDWVVAVFDSQRQRIARSRAPELKGTAPTPSLSRLMSTMGTASEVYGAARTIEGGEALTALARVGATNWTVALGIPAVATTQVQRSSAVQFGSGVVLSLLLAGGSAWLFARRIALPMQRLTHAASALGRGEPVAPSRSDIVEIDAVASALVAAAELRAGSERERDTLLTAEQAARTAAQEAGRRLTVLAGASSALARSLEEDETLESIGALLVPAVCDLCRIDLLDGSGVLERRLTRHFDPDRSRAIADFVSRHVSGSAAPGSFPWVVATGRTFLVNAEQLAEGPGRDPALREFIQVARVHSACVVPLVARGRVIGVLAAIQAESRRRFTEEDAALVADLGQRIAMTLDNVRLLAESRAAVQKAELASVAKDEFLAMLGHELRNPLAPILAALELMKRRHGQSAVYEREVIYRQVKHLSRMVDDLLDVARITSGKVKLQIEDVDLRQVVSRSVELTHPAFEKRAHEPDVDVPAEPVHVRGDFLRLTQTVTNLLINAAKFSAADTRVGLRIDLEPGWACLAVSDRGIGIRPDLLPRIFERFVQDEQTLQRAAGGLGLGLAIAKNLVELHGGSIRAESAGPDQGSCFTIRLPLLTEGLAATQAPPAETAHSRRFARVLMIDDNHDAVQTLAQLVTEAGHVVGVARSAEEALERLAHEHFDAAVVDIGLPGLSGYDFARVIRNDPRTRSMHLVALTGYGQTSDRTQALLAGFEDHLVKPVQSDDLLTALDKLLATPTHEVDAAPSPAAPDLA